VHLLLDTQILVWMVNGDSRLRQIWQDAIAAPDNDLYVSAVVAFEFTDLQQRKRLPVDETIAELVSRFELIVEPLPASCWELLLDLPAIHRDPVDRMLVTHAMAKDMALLTADTNIRRYPVDCI
jgi:PIN domain nuclease of toxin-antitoxin system